MASTLSRLKNKTQTLIEFTSRGPYPDKQNANLVHSLKTIPFYFFLTGRKVFWHGALIARLHLCALAFQFSRVGILYKHSLPKAYLHRLP